MSRTRPGWTTRISLNMPTWNGLNTPTITLKQRGLILREWSLSWMVLSLAQLCCCMLVPITRLELTPLNNNGKPLQMPWRRIHWFHSLTRHTKGSPLAASKKMLGQSDTSFKKVSKCWFLNPLPRISDYTDRELVHYTLLVLAKTLLLKFYHKSRLLLVKCTQVPLFTGPW